MFRPDEDRELLRFGCGITNLVERATAAADELSRDELLVGARNLQEKAGKYRVEAVAVLGISAYRRGFERPAATLGAQSERLGEAMVWVLPNPSGLNAHFTPKDLAKLFREFRLRLAQP